MEEFVLFLEDIFGLAKPEYLKQDNARIIVNAQTPNKKIENEDFGIETKASQMSTKMEKIQDFK